MLKSGHAHLDRAAAAAVDDRYPQNTPTGTALQIGQEDSR